MGDIWDHHAKWNPADLDGFYYVINPGLIYMYLSVYTCDETRREPLSRGRVESRKKEG